MLSALDKQNEDVIALTAHWKSRTELEVCYFQEYQLLSSFCCLKGQHGGSLISCRESLKSTVRKDYEILSIAHIIQISAML
ncbi:hypothetical protein WA026_001199 [Henosepilachna vigintioctopunctata]|uniref:Uncharacterized protein n=1 Tax=Henosepilachna vigintioctopunctata TaxID=420089 RepID=A0AAW1UKG0_9CUCU